MKKVMRMTEGLLTFTKGGRSSGAASAPAAAAAAAPAPVAAAAAPDPGEMVLLMRR